MQANVHADQISRHLGKLQFTGQPLAGKRLVILGFFNRSGSNLLGDYLRSMPGLHGFGEQLNHAVVIKQCQRHGIDSFPDYVAHIAGRGKGPVFGIKASGSQIEMLKKWNIPAMFESVSVVHVFRNDIVAQAVSFWIAKHTKQWKSFQDPAAGEQAATYSFKHLAKIVDTIGAQNARIITACAAARLPVWNIAYENLIRDPQGELAAAGAFLGLDLAGWQVPEQTAHQKQDSPLKAEFAERLRRDLMAQW